VLALVVLRLVDELVLDELVLAGLVENKAVKLNSWGVKRAKASEIKRGTGIKATSSKGRCVWNLGSSSLTRPLGSVRLVFDPLSKGWPFCIEIGLNCWSCLFQAFKAF
ncbi:MAG: hypothetical protein ACREHG_04485, partial [Candidatus Saccharimonadales bacterium]